MPFNEIFLNTLARALNGALHYAPGTRQQLTMLGDKTLVVETQEPALSLSIHFVGGDLVLESTASASARRNTPNAIVRGKSFAFLRHAIQNPQKRQVIGGEIEIEGDLPWVQALERILQSPDFDWEAPLAHVVGDVGAQTLGQALRSATGWLKKSVDTLLWHSEEYLHYESNSLPTRHEVNNFLADVGTLRDDYDRIEARVQELEMSLHLTPSTPSKPAPGE